MSNPLKMVYTVGVQRWPLPFYKRFKVLGHKTVEEGSLTRLQLSLEDGSYIAIPALHRRRVKVYSDYTSETQRVEAIKALVNHPEIPVQG